MIVFLKKTDGNRDKRLVIKGEGENGTQAVRMGKEGVKLEKQ